MGILQQDGQDINYLQDQMAQLQMNKTGQEEKEEPVELDGKTISV